MNPSSPTSPSPRMSTRVPFRELIIPETRIITPTTKSEIANSMQGQVMLDRNDRRSRNAPRNGRPDGERPRPSARYARRS